MDNADFTLPCTFNQRFILEEILGEGGMGKVFKARDEVLGKEVAIKLLNTELMESRLVRFQQEARAIARLNHVNILQVFDFARAEDGSYYLTMEHLPGASLESLLVEKGCLGLEQFYVIARQLLEGLAHAHEHGVLHRDVKPSNVMLVKDETSDEEGMVVKLVDFGLAKLASEKSDQDGQSLTSTGAVLGSPLYMSPEQVRGDELGPGTDIYSFGCLAYRCLTGEPPFLGKDALTTMGMHLNDELRAPHEVSIKNPLSEEQEKFILRCLAKDSSMRFPTAAAARQALELTFGAGASLSSAEGIDEDFESFKAKSAQESRQVWILLGLSFCIGLAIFAGLMHFLLREGEDKDPERSVRHRSIFLSLPEDGVFKASDKLRIESDGTVKYQSSPLSIESFKKLPRVPGIVKISLLNCSVSDQGMSYIAQCKSLRELRLAGNKGISPGSFARLADLCDLQRLFLSNMDLSNEHVEALSKIKTITYLDLSLNSGIDGNAFPSLEKMNDLRDLTVGGNSMTISEIVDFVNDNPDILRLGLHGLSKENLKGYRDLSKLREIDEIDLSDNDSYVADQLLDSVVRVPGLKRLQLNQTGIKSSRLLVLNENPTIKLLSLKKCSFVDSDMKSLAKLRYLKQVILDYNMRLSDAGIDILKTAPAIEHIRSPNCDTKKDTYFVSR